MNDIVKKTIHVDADREHAFDVFVGEIGLWWPLASHHIGAQIPTTAVIEPRVGGRWFERAEDGTECVWGRVAVYERPSRLVLIWAISADWKSEPALETEVEVRFAEIDARTTTVELEHRHLDRYGERAAEMIEVFKSPGGWSLITDRLRDHFQRESELAR